VIAAAQQFHQRLGSILIVGGEKFGLVHFDNQGNYLGYRANTSCAAGTGSNKNEAIIPYLSFLKKSGGGKLARAGNQTRRTHGTMV